MQRRPHLRLKFGAKPFSTGSYHEPVLKIPNEPVLKIPNEPVLKGAGALGSGTGTNATFSTGS